MIKGNIQATVDNVSEGGRILNVTMSVYWKTQSLTHITTTVESDLFVIGLNTPTGTFVTFSNPQRIGLQFKGTRGSDTFFTCWSYFHSSEPF